MPLPRPKISVMFPTRNRRPQVMESMTSLLANAAESPQVDFMIAVDPDQDQVLDFPGAATVQIWVAPERYGYGGLHKYYNELAVRARGDWLMLWNDDALMLTKGWDAVVVSQSLDMVLQPWHSDGGYAHNDFPIWPRKWTNFIGYVSKVSCTDAWMSHTGELAGRTRQIPVKIRHDRPQDVIDAHRGTAEDLYHPAMISLRERNAARLCSAIRNGVL